MNPSAKNLTGQRFHRLTAIRPTNRRIGGNIIWECRCDCGRIVLVRSQHLIRGEQKSCGCLRRDKSTSLHQGQRGPRNKNWKGGRSVQRGGYIRIYNPNHPHHNVNGYVFDHRLVMERILGRHLKPGEVVHHIDGNPANNSPGNLRLFPNQSAHTAHHRKVEKLKEEVAARA